MKAMLSLSYPEEFVIFRVVSFPTFPIKSIAWFNAVIILWKDCACYTILSWILFLLRVELYFMLRTSETWRPSSRLNL